MTTTTPATNPTETHPAGLPPARDQGVGQPLPSIAGTLHDAPAARRPPGVCLHIPGAWVSWTPMPTPGQPPLRTSGPPGS